MTALHFLDRLEVVSDFRRNGFLWCIAFLDIDLCFQKLGDITQILCDLSAILFGVILAFDLSYGFVKLLDVVLQSGCTTRGFVL